MTENIKEKSLRDCLHRIMVSELPKQLKGDTDSYWLESVVLVRKLDFSESYALAKRGADGVIRYIYDSGSISPIKALIAIYPYIYLDTKRYFQYNDIADMRNALAIFIGGDDKARKAVSKLTDSDVEKNLLGIAIKRQYASLKQNEEGDEITESVFNITLENMGISDTKSNNFDENDEKEQVNNKDTNDDAPRRGRRMKQK